MPRKSDKRERLIKAADDLIHRQGFYKTTLADIAEESNVPLGNVYYYFKTKDEICQAVIEERKMELTRMLNGCCTKTDPKHALIQLIKALISASEEIADKGCPHGRLCSELDSQITSLTSSADGCMNVLLEWASDQFKALGHRNAKDMGFEYVARIQGTILLGHSMHDEKRVRSQLKSLCNWVETLGDYSVDNKVTAA